jgi:hypothetical protein
MKRCPICQKKRPDYLFDKYQNICLDCLSRVVDVQVQKAQTKRYKKYWKEQKDEKYWN